MNAPERWELFVLPEGVKKLSIQKDTRITNTATFVVQKEDHTLANMLRTQLLKDKQINFAGYRMPHPLEHYFLLRVRTSDQSTPVEALNNTLYDRISELNLLEERFRAELRTKGDMSIPLS